MVFVRTGMLDFIVRMFGDSFVYANIAITPDVILGNKLAFFDVDFFNNTLDSSLMGSEYVVSAVYAIRNIVSQVYVTLRDISLILIIIVAVICVIRLLMENRPMERKRILDMLMNCVKGIALIIVMHYIMYILVTINNNIVSGFMDSGSVEIEGATSAEEVADAALSDLDKIKTTGDTVKITEMSDNHKIYDHFKENAGLTLDESGNVISSELTKDDLKNKYTNVGVIEGSADGKKVYYTVILASNFSEIARYRMQKLYDVDEDNNQSTSRDYVSWAIVYFLLVALTVVYSWLYAKRVIYIAVLTMLAPIVGMMYPLNKLNGGRAQTLNIWLREYVGALLIQPFHVLLYAVLISGAFSLALNSPIYVIVALISMITIERFVRELIGFGDTKIGSLGNSLKEVTKGINTAVRTANRVVGVGGKVAAGAIRGGAGIVNGAMDTIDDIKNGKIRMQENAGQVDEKKKGEVKQLKGKEAEQAALTAGKENQSLLLAQSSQEKKNGLTEEEKKNKGPLAIGMGDKATKGIQLPYDEGLDLFDRTKEKNDGEGPNQFLLPDVIDEVAKLGKNGEIDEEKTLKNYFNAGGKRNENGEFFNPHTGRFDSKYNPLNDSSYIINRDGKAIDSATESKEKKKGGFIDEEATLKKYADENYVKDLDGNYFNPNTNMFDPNYSPLNDPKFRVEKLGDEEKTKEKAKASNGESGILGENDSVRAYSTPDGNIRLESKAGTKMDEQLHDNDQKNKNKAKSSEKPIEFSSIGTNPNERDVNEMVANSDIITRTTVGSESRKDSLEENEIGGTVSNSDLTGESNKGTISMGGVSSTGESTISFTSVSSNKRSRAQSSRNSVNYVGNESSTTTNNTTQEIHSRTITPNSIEERRNEIKNSDSVSDISYQSGNSGGGSSYTSNNTTGNSNETSISVQHREASNRSVSHTSNRTARNNSGTTIDVPYREIDSGSESSRNSTSGSNSDVIIDVPYREVNSDSTQASQNDTRGNDSDVIIDVPYSEVKDDNSIDTAIDAPYREIPEEKSAVTRRMERREKVNNIANSMASVVEGSTQIVDHISKAVEVGNNAIEKTLGNGPIGVVEATNDIINASIDEIGSLAGTVTPKKSVKHETQNEVQESREVKYVKREYPEIKQEIIIRAVGDVKKYGNTYGINDEKNTAIIAKLYQETGKSGEKLIAIAAQVIQAKKDGHTENEVMHYLERLDIANKDRRALMEVFRKA